MKSVAQYAFRQETVDHERESDYLIAMNIHIVATTPMIKY